MIKTKAAGFLVEGDSSRDVLIQAWSLIQKQGSEYHSQRGLVRSIKGVTLVVNKPTEGGDEAHYPYWSKADDDWYQDNFVRKETNLPASALNQADIYPYKYVWRSRYMDNGLGHVKATADLFKAHGHSKVDFKTQPDLVKFLKQTYSAYHPENILAALAWKGKVLMDFYLAHPKILELELACNQADTLEAVIAEIKASPASRRAITPSFTIEAIDHSGAAGGVPVYQNYQLFTEFGRDGQPVGLVSFHQHRAFDAMGGTQLDVSHDRDWGMIASQAVGLPLLRMVIYCNDMYYHVPADGGHQDLVAKTNVRHWLFAVTDGYDPKVEDIEKRLASPIYQKKLDVAWARIK